MKIVGNREKERQSPRPRRVLLDVAVLPSMATLGNLVCGFGAIYMCLLSVQAGGEDLIQTQASESSMRALFPTYIAIGAYLLIGAMILDGLDGRLARLTRKTSEFGGQLDSLSDIVSFGVAPAMLVLCAVHPGKIAELGVYERAYWRAEWVMAAVYVCCAALRLARFNVENEEHASAHMAFRGLPSPGAAAAVVGLLIFHEDLLRAGEVAPAWAAGLTRSLLPPTIMLLGLLMVSRFPYPHLVNSLLRGRRPFRQVVALALLCLFFLVASYQLTLAVVGVAFALSGPIVRLFRGKAVRADDTLLTSESPDWLDESETFEVDDEDAEGRASENDDTSRRSTG